MTLTGPELKNRYGYHKATETTGPIHQEIRKRFLELATWIDANLPDGRAKSVALTELESASMWSNKANAELAPVVDE